MPEILKPRVSPKGGVFRFAANRRRQINIALPERSPQPGHGLLTLAELDVLAGEGDRRNVSTLRARAQALEGPGGPEEARRGVAGAAPAPTDETPECGVAPLAGGAPARSRSSSRSAARGGPQPPPGGMPRATA